MFTNQGIYLRIAAYAILRRVIRTFTFKMFPIVSKLIIEIPQTLKKYLSCRENNKGSVFRFSLIPSTIDCITKDCYYGSIFRSTSLCKDMCPGCCGCGPHLQMLDDSSYILGCLFYVPLLEECCWATNVFLASLSFHVCKG